VPELTLVFAAEKAAEKKFWILDPLYTALGHTLAWFYGFVGDYGLAIVLLTVAVRVLLIPLTIKQIRSMQAMQRLQPEIKRLQQQYKDDRQKLNEETMKFYKENKVTRCRVACRSCCRCRCSSCSTGSSTTSCRCGTGSPDSRGTFPRTASSTGRSSMLPGTRRAP
jgi:hypothetical protein